MITITVTKEQAEELLRATTYLYVNYSSREEWPDENLRRINDQYIYRYNNSVDELRETIKGAIKNDRT